MQQISSIEYECSVGTLLRDAPDFVVHGMQVGTVLGSQVWDNEMRCRVGHNYHGVRNKNLSQFSQGKVRTLKTRCGGVHVFVLNSICGVFLQLIA